MNIKEHIEAGHYSWDETAGAWNVVLRNNTTAKVFSTSLGGNAPLIGVVSVAVRGWTPILWDVHGCPEGNSSHWSMDFEIQMPPPRKIIVKRWGWVGQLPSKATTCLYDNESMAREHASRFVNRDNWKFIAWTGEYLEEWK